MHSWWVRTDALDLRPHGRLQRLAVTRVRLGVNGEETSVWAGEADHKVHVSVPE